MDKIKSNSADLTHQVNIKLTNEDMERLEKINSEHFTGEASNSMLGRILIRKGMEWYEKGKE